MKWWDQMPWSSFFECWVLLFLYNKLISECTILNAALSYKSILFFPTPLTKIDRIYSMKVSWRIVKYLNCSPYTLGIVLSAHFHLMRYCQTKCNLILTLCSIWPIPILIIQYFLHDWVSPLFHWYRHELSTFASIIFSLSLVYSIHLGWEQWLHPPCCLKHCLCLILPVFFFFFLLKSYIPDPFLSFQILASNPIRPPLPLLHPVKTFCWDEFDHRIFHATNVTESKNLKIPHIFSHILEPEEMPNQCFHMDTDFYKNLKTKYFKIFVWPLIVLVSLSSHSSHIK